MRRTLLLLLFSIPFLSLFACQGKEDQGDASVTNPPEDLLTVSDCKKCLIITDQAAPAIDMVDVGRNGKIVWSWNAAASNIGADKVKWFSNPDDAKPVYNRKYLLINASGGGVALVRIADKKPSFTLMPVKIHIPPNCCRMAIL